MLASGFLRSRVEGGHRILSLSRVASLAAALAGCSTPPQGEPGRAMAAQNVQHVEQCSTLGIIACRAMALLSSDSVPTCSASRARDGRLIEACGYAPTRPPTARVPTPADPRAYPVHLAWSDNSDNESNFVIERCDQISIVPVGTKTTASCTGAWRSIATVGANATSFVDNTAALNQTYIYRVKAINSKGSSGYTQEEMITTPAR
jgi:hypothetical protein